MRYVLGAALVLIEALTCLGSDESARAAVAVAVASAAQSPPAKAPPAAKAACDCPATGKCDCGPGCKCEVKPAAAPADNRADALDEVNAWRAKNGYRPFVRDEGLTRAARACAAFRADRLLFGHTPNDFAFLPAGCHADAAGCAAYPPSYGWLSCCMRDPETYAGAAWAMGADGKRYMHCFVGNRPNTLAGPKATPKATPPAATPAPAPESLPADPELAGVQVPIPRSRRVFNRSGIQCAWCTVQMLATHNGHAAARGLIDTHRGNIGHMEQLRSELARLGIRSWYTPARDADALERFCRAGYGVGVGVHGGAHMLLVCHCDRAGNTVKIIDNSDRSLRVQTLTWPQFSAMWSDTVFVVPPAGATWAAPPAATQPTQPTFAASPAFCPSGR